MTTSIRNTKIVGRLAPSPSGEMHLGNAFTYVLAWCAARKLGGKVLFRMEDIDERCKREDLKVQVIDDMRWLGLTWDGEITYQSNRTHIYDEIFHEIAKKGLVYPCFCSRADLHAASAPHKTDGTYVYSGKCKNLKSSEIAEIAKTKNPSYRIKVPDVAISITDEICGQYSQNLKTECGDFVIRRSDNVPAYQFAVSVDDYLQGINQIVRGNDLLSSTPRQVFLRDVISFVTTSNDGYYADSKRLDRAAQSLQFAHVPLLTDRSGRRLAKRDRDLTVKALRESGVCAKNIIGYFAYILKFIDTPEQMSLEELLKMFALDKIENRNIVADCGNILSFI